MILFIWIVISLSIVIGGISEGIMDTLQHHFEESVFKDKNKYFWNPVYSGNNKWKNGDKTQGEKFFLSSTLLVARTEAWHLFKTFRTFFLFLGIGLSGFVFGVWGIIITRVMFGIVFTVTYKYLKT